MSKFILFTYEETPPRENWFGVASRFLNCPFCAYAKKSFGHLLLPGWMFIDEILSSELQVFIVLM